MSENTEKVVVDLFAGLRGWSQAFHQDSAWTVYTVDVTETFARELALDPWGLATLTVADHCPHDLVANILDVTAAEIRALFDAEPDVLVVLASPPCTKFSIASCSTHWKGVYQPRSEDAEAARDLVEHTVELIRDLDPDYWFLENPRGMLRRHIGEPQAEIWFCQYGDDAAKPTDLWGHLPNTFEIRQCHNGNEDCHHEPAERGSDSGTQGKDSSAERARIPAGLSAAVKRAVETAPETPEYPEPRFGDVSTQAFLTGFTESEGSA